jgi:CHAT domain-containing protein
MLRAKTRRFKLAAFSIVALMGFCMAQTSTVSTPPDPKDGEGRQELAVAEALRANWTATSLRAAINHYEKAALFWSSISDFSNASEATLRTGDIYFLFSEYAQALKQFQDAETLAQKSGDWLAQATALSQMGRAQSYLGKNDLAQRQLTKALDLFKSHEANQTAKATNAYGEALSNLAEVSYSKGNFLNASKHLESALEVFQNNPKGEARARLFKGYIAGSIGDTNTALAEIVRALELYREINDKSGEGLALTAMGMWHSSSNQDHNRAIELHKEALEIFRVIGDQYSEAVARNAIGQSYDILTEHSNALTYYNSALALFEKTGALNAASSTTCGIAFTQLVSGNLDEARASYDRCLHLSRTTGNVRIQTFALEGIARIYGAQGHHQLVMKQYQDLAQHFERIGDLRAQATALNWLGDFFFQQGDKRKALDVFGQSFSLTEKMGDKGILIATLYNLARANEALGFHETALSLIKRSFTFIEEIRENVASPDFRASYFSTVRRHYDLCIEILMQLDKLRPQEGFAAQAFSVSEQARARLLLDLLSESRSRFRAGAALDLVEQEVRLRGLLRAQAQYQLGLSLSGKDSSELTEVTDQIVQLRSDYQVVQAQLRKKNPRLFSFEQFVPADLEDIQQELHGSDTMLLEYSLGDDHSYLWAVTSDTSETYILPPRKEIEEAVREFHKVLTARQRTAGQSAEDYQANVAAADNIFPEKATNLSRMLLMPVIEKLGSRTLLVVPDGALQYIPFAALPVQFTKTNGLVGSSTNFLLETNDVVMLPSASTLLAIRRKQNHKSSPGKLVAVIADPVFNPSDDRVQREPQAPATAEAATVQNPDQPEQKIKNLNVARLPHASDEADAISSVAPWGTTLVAKGFDASRETAMSSEVSRVQIVHIASHGFLDSEHPELSGILLTTMDRNGANVNGLMPLPDIYSLDLSAELTVLSACQTGLGKDIKGEGLVGLTHSFMSAGSKSVVASLWKVDDRATATLMADFYDGMLQKGMTPAAALRSAKLKMMQQKQWSAPYYWAGFVVQGEYTNHIAVDRYRWLRLVLIPLLLLSLMAVALLVLRKRRQRRIVRHSSFITEHDE